jgi:hypothetical protein
MILTLVRSSTRKSSASRRLATPPRWSLIPASNAITRLWVSPCYRRDQPLNQGPCKVPVP